MPALELESGHRVAYADHGAGPPLVLLHGWSFGAAVLDALPARVREGRRALAPDLRGHGAAATSGTGASFTLGDLAADLAGLFEALRLEGVTVVGWSLGGLVALAALPRLRPRVSRLVLLSATPCFTIRDGWPHGVPARSVAALARQVRRDPAHAIERFSEGMFVEGELDPTARARAVALRAAIPPPDPAADLAGLVDRAATYLRHTHSAQATVGGAA